MKIKFTILGCGYSMGVPRIDGYCGNCDPNNKKYYRSRCSALISTSDLNILIDTSPDIKFQLTQRKIKNIDKVFYTHAHADQTHGINDLRVFYLKNRKKIPVYADNSTRKYLLKSFKYCFENTSEYPPILKMNDLKKIHIFKKKNKIIRLKTIKVQHGNIKSIAYIINNKLRIFDVILYYQNINKYKYLIFIIFN